MEMKVIDAVLITPQGKEVNLEKPYYIGYGDGVTYVFDLGKVGFKEGAFDLRGTVFILAQAPGGASDQRFDARDIVKGGLA